MPVEDAPAPERSDSDPTSPSSRYWSGEGRWVSLALARLTGIYWDLDDGRDGARAILQSSEHRPAIFSLATYRSFFAGIPSAVRVVAQSPQILLFAALQWMAVVLGYLAWTRVLQLIPDEAWNAIDDAVSKDEHSPVLALCNLTLLAWTFVVVSVVAYPVGLCSAAMVAVNDLRTSREQVTLAKCIAIADRHLGRIWAFTIIDSWITVWAILDRLPKKGSNRSALDELAYYAWKVGTVGVVPALVNGRSFASASRDSLTLLKARTSEALGLRLGYSAVCWFVGIAAYLASFLFVRAVEGALPGQAHRIFHFYLLMAVPVAIASAVVTVLLRPFFLLGVSALYAELIDVKDEVDRDVCRTSGGDGRGLPWRLLLFLAMLVALLGAIFFSDELGLTGRIARWGHLDLQRYHEGR